MPITAGSTMDTFGTMALQRKDFLSPVLGLVSTPKPLPSEPVPQVVGITIRGNALSLVLRLNI